MHVALRLTILALLTIGTVVPAVEHELLMTNGETVRGVILEQTDTMVILERTIETKAKTFTTKMTYLRSKIAKISEVVEKVDPAQEYVKRSKRVENTLDDHLALAKWCDANGLKHEAIRHYGLALKTTPGHEESLTRLAEHGAMEVDGEWMHPDEFATRAGIEDNSDAEKQQARERTVAIVKANQLEQRLAELTKQQAKLSQRVQQLPLDIATAQQKAFTASSTMQMATASANGAGQRADDLWRQINEAVRNNQEEYARQLRLSHAREQGEEARYRKDAKAAAATKAEAERDLARFQREQIDTKPKLDKVTAELRKVEEEIVAARAARDAANAAANP